MKQTEDVITTVKAGVGLDELQDPTSSIEFSLEQALQFVVELRTSDPSTPADGQIWLRSDL